MVEDYGSFGLLSGILTLLIIGIGFPLVIFTERWLGYLWWPYMMGLGFAIVVASLFINNDGVCVVVAILGVTLIWGSTELKEQAIRAELAGTVQRAQNQTPVRIHHHEMESAPSVMR